jgi:hypothetical protein
MFVPGEQSSNDLSFSVKIQTKSELEILVLAMPARSLPISAYANSFNSPNIVHRFEASCERGHTGETPAMDDVADHPMIL